jgi:hypothetical protein
MVRGQSEGTTESTRAHGASRIVYTTAPRFTPHFVVPGQRDTALARSHAACSAPRATRHRRSSSRCMQSAPVAPRPYEPPAAPRRQSRCRRRLHRDWAYHRSQICMTERSPATSAPGLGSPLSHLHRDWAHLSHMCATERAPHTCAPRLGSPRTQLHHDWAHPYHICTGTYPRHICTATGLTPHTAASGLSSPWPHLHHDWAHPCHVCTGTGLDLATSAPGPGSTLPHLRRHRAHL